MLGSRQLASHSRWKALSGISSVIRTPYSLSGDNWYPSDPVELPLYSPFLVFCPGLCSQSLPTSLAQLHNFLVLIVYSLSPRMAWLTITCCEIKPLPWLTLKGQITQHKDTSAGTHRPAHLLRRGSVIVLRTLSACFGRIPSRLTHLIAILALISAVKGVKTWKPKGMKTRMTLLLLLKHHPVHSRSSMNWC